MKTIANQRIQSAVLTAVFLMSLLSACKEVPPFIDYTPPILLAKDTTYVVTPPPAADDKNVLIEDISGVRCVNCPEAAEEAHKIKDNYDDGRIVVTTLHSTKFSIFTRPIKDTFNTEEATLIVDNLIGSPNGLPNGAVDRIIYPGKTDAVLRPETWASFAESQALLKTTVNLELELIPNKEERNVVTNIKSTFIDASAESVYLSVFVTESHIISPQYTITGEEENFEHNFILRKAITPYNGIKLADNVEVGRVFEKGLTIEIPEKWNFDNCSIVVLVNKNEADNHEVLQSVEGHLKP